MSELFKHLPLIKRWSIKALYTAGHKKYNILRKVKKRRRLVNPCDTHVEKMLQKNNNGFELRSQRALSSQLTDMMRLDDFNRHISSGCECAFSAAECAVGQHFGTPPPFPK